LIACDDDDHHHCHCSTTRHQSPSPWFCQATCVVARISARARGLSLRGFETRCDTKNEVGPRAGRFIELLHRPAPHHGLQLTFKPQNRLRCCLSTNTPELAV
jgi:hypothetical protein